MKHIDEFRNSRFAYGISKKIKDISKKRVKLMEFCGGHTVTRFKHGIMDILPDTIDLISGPGCPVCVTSIREVDKIVTLSMMSDMIITSFGDMIRVPGSNSSLQDKKAEGADVRVVYSTYDALKVAMANPDKRVVFMGIGFETTIPTAAAAIIKAYKENIDNFYLLSAHKTSPAILKVLLESGPDIDGFICPGHVTAIMGTTPFYMIAEDYKKSCVVSGFEAIDLLQSIYMLISQIENNESRVEIEYSRVVKPAGNHKALSVIDEVFDSCYAEWRGIGMVSDSGLKIKEKYRQYDAESVFDITVDDSHEEFNGCICGDILKGFKTPIDCKLFNTICTFEKPVGACMVSDEGTCAAYFRYR